MVGRLVWLVGWLIFWLVGWFVFSLVGCLVDWFGRSVGWSVGWLVGWLVVSRFFACFCVLHSPSLSPALIADQISIKGLCSYQPQNILLPSKSTRPMLAYWHNNSPFPPNNVSCVLLLFCPFPSLISARTASKRPPGCHASPPCTLLISPRTP